MKKTLIIFIFSILTLSVFSQEKDFIDYFNTLPNEFSHSYTIETIKGEWATKSNAEYQITPFVDLETRYLKIVDQRTGGGTVTLTASMYFKTDGYPIISISMIEYDGPNLNKNTNFYEWINESWKPITKLVLGK